MAVFIIYFRFNKAYLNFYKLSHENFTRKDKILFIDLNTYLKYELFAGENISNLGLEATFKHILFTEKYSNITKIKQKGRQIASLKSFVSIKFKMVIQMISMNINTYLQVIALLYSLLPRVSIFYFFFLLSNSTTKPPFPSQIIQ